MLMLAADLVADIDRGPGSSDPQSLAVFAERLIFSADTRRPIHVGRYTSADTRDAGRD